MRDTVSRISELHDRRIELDNGWKITGQETSSNDSSFDAKNETEKSTSHIRISTNPYSKILEIDASYYDEE